MANRPVTRFVTTDTVENDWQFTPEGYNVSAAIDYFAATFKTDLPNKVSGLLAQQTRPIEG